MIKLAITEPVEMDIETIWFHILTQSYLEYADAFIDKLYRQFELLAHNPDMGVKRIEIGEEARLYPVDKINIIYRVQSAELQILRVHHSALDPNALVL